MIGVAFGLLVRAGDHAGGPIVWLVNIAGPWLLLAFAIGALAPDPRAAAERAIAALIAAVLAKYALQLAEGDIDLTHALLRTLAWGAAAVVIGLVFGPAGQRRAYLLLAAAVALEALAFLIGPLNGESAHLRYSGQTAAVAVFAGELLVAVALVAANGKLRW